MAETQELPNLKQRLFRNNSQKIFNDVPLDNKRQSSGFSQNNAALLMHGKSLVQILVEDNKKPFGSHRSSQVLG